MESNAEITQQNIFIISSSIFSRKPFVAITAVGVIGVTMKMKDLNLLQSTFLLLV